MELPNQADVIVVGAGPTGLALAGELRSAGVDTLVLDRARAGANTSRAAVIHAKTLEALEASGVTKQLLADGVVVPVFTIRDRQRLLASIDFAGLPTKYPFTLMLPQSRTEQILAGRLEASGGCIHRDVTVTGVTSSDGGAIVTVTDQAGSVRELKARYVVGADGMHSAVRQSMGIDFVGAKYPQSFILADVHMTWPLDAAEVQLFFSPAGLVVVAPLPGGVHRVVATMDQAPETPGIDDVQRVLDERGPGSATVSDLVWSARFQVHHRVAQSYRKGPVFLAGDAAHVHSPAGGQGMNTGIQDGVDLAHALTDALRPKGSDLLIDGYEARRLPVALRVVAATDRATKVATARALPARLARNAMLTYAGHVGPIRRKIAMQLTNIQG